jgi:hypothetical protein
VKCDIVIVSHKKDLCWLEYCLRLLRKNWREYSRIIVRVEEDCREIVEKWAMPGVEFYYVVPWPDGYAFQMYQKMISDDYTDADLLMLVDSDLMLVEPFDLGTLLESGLPVIYYLEWCEQKNGVAEKVWRRPTSQLMGLDLDRDYMVSPPFLYWRETLQRTRRRIVQQMGMSFFDAVYSDHPFDFKRFMDHPHKFADFEALGLCASNFQLDRYRLKHLSKRPEPYPFRLYWSHGDWNLKVKNQLENLLANT